MKTTKVRSRFTGLLLDGVDAKCYTALMNLRAAERKADDDLKADIKRKAAELKTAAERKATKEHPTAARRNAAAVKYRAAARQAATKYEFKARRQAMNIQGVPYKMSRIAVERKVDELLLEAIDEQNGQNGNLHAYLSGLRSSLQERLNKIGGI